MKIIDSIRRGYRSHKIRQQYESIERAIKYKAEKISSLEFHRTMANFYTDRVLATDPNVDWWGFAAAKQKQHDHQDEFTQLELVIEEAEARVQAQKNAFEALHAAA